MIEQACARNELSDALRIVCAHVVEIFSRNDARDALDRYAIGCIIRDVRASEKTYGQGSVGKIARRIGRDVDTLYEYANVAETWSEVELKRLLERRTPAGLPLSFTHLVVLARVRRRRDRLKVLTDRAFEGISARHLRDLIDEERHRGDERSDVAPVLTRLRQLVTYGDRVLSVSKQLGVSLADVQSIEVSGQLASLLESATERQRQLAQICQMNVETLEAERARISAIVAEADPVADDEPPTHAVDVHGC